MSKLFGRKSKAVSNAVTLTGKSTYQPHSDSHLTNFSLTTWKNKKQSFELIFSVAQVTSGFQKFLIKSFRKVEREMINIWNKDLPCAYGLIWTGGWYWLEQVAHLCFLQQTCGFDSPSFAPQKIEIRKNSSKTGRLGQFQYNRETVWTCKGLTGWLQFTWARHPSSRPIRGHSSSEAFSPGPLLHWFNYTAATDLL